MRRRMIALYAVVLTVVLTVTAVGGIWHTGQAAVTERTPSLMPTVTVDAGHGGFDGGAVAKDGTAEKELNLAVVLPLADFLRVCGVNPVLTRAQDTALGTEQGTVREKKKADMRARLQAFEQADMNVSIHQNSFSDTRYHGAQVFYSTNHAASQRLAEAIRQRIVSDVQADNTRELKSGNRDVYLLYKATKPTVLVECGFLSNPQELDLLKEDAYRRRMACAIALGVAAFAAEEGGTV